MTTMTITSAHIDMPRRNAYAGGETSGPSYTPNCWYGLSGSHGMTTRSLSEL